MLTHGRRLNAKRRLVWVGRYVGGKPSGVCWSFVSGGGAVVGKVDCKGKLTGEEGSNIFSELMLLLTYVRWPTSILTTAQPFWADLRMGFWSQAGPPQSSPSASKK